MKKILFIHTPKFNNYYPLLGNFMTITQMPSGMMALADIARQEGYKTQIVHLGVELIINPNFSLAAYLKEFDPQVVALSLHWHPQSYDVTRALTTVRRVLPEAFILLGGYTATHFAREILETCPEADAIIRGDAEEPLRAFLQKFPSNREDLSELPNFAWRKGGEIFENSIYYVSGTGEIEAATRADISLVKHGETYAVLAQYLWFYRLNRTLEQNLYEIKVPTGFPILLTRGCDFNCIYCGGSRASQKKLTGRSRMICVSTDYALREIKRLMSFGVKLIFIEYAPLGDDDEYYIKLFKAIRRERLRVAFNVESRALPSIRFYKEFARTFGGMREAKISFSPDSGIESSRKKIKRGIQMSDGDLFAAFQNMERLKINFEVYFSIGLPGNIEEEIRAIRDKIKEINRLFKHARAVRVNSVELDPASPIYYEPEKYGIADPLSSFADFIAYHQSGVSMFFGRGYGLAAKGNAPASDREEHYQKMMRLHCENFCKLTQSFSWRLPDNACAMANKSLRAFCDALEKAHSIKSAFKNTETPFPY